MPEEARPDLRAAIEGNKAPAGLTPATEWISLPVLYRLMREAAALPPEQGEPLDAAIETIENVLTGMDWLGTGGSMQLADEEESEAWQAWDVILEALGRPGDSRLRVYGEPHHD